MSRTHCLRLHAQSLVSTALYLCAALSFSNEAAAGLDPLNAQAPVPALQYRSSLHGFRALGDEKVGDWRKANETVQQIGGWRTYLKEAQQPDATEVQAPPGIAPASGANAGSEPAGRTEAPVASPPENATNTPSHAPHHDHSKK